MKDKVINSEFVEETLWDIPAHLKEYHGIVFSKIVNVDIVLVIC